MKIQKIENFLPEEEFVRIHEMFITDRESRVPLFYRTGASAPSDNTFVFGNSIFNSDDDGRMDLHLFNNIGIPIVSRLPMTTLRRFKINVYPNYGQERMMSSFHIDSGQPHSVGLYSLNKCNGYTEFENGDILPSEENTMYVFDGKLSHRSVSQTDTNLRVNFNLNFYCGEFW